jgi:hypothetical protein
MIRDLPFLLAGEGAAMKRFSAIRAGAVLGWVLLVTTGVEGQGPRHSVARDFNCLAASLGPLVTIDFEDLPHEASSCPSGARQVPILNPLEISGATFTDPACLATAFCSSPTCARDPANPSPGNTVLVLHGGGTVDLPPGTGAAILDVEGIGSSPFALRAIDVLGESVDVSEAGELYSAIYVVFTSSVGLSRIEVVDAGGTGGPLALAAIFLGRRLGDGPPGGCEDPPPPDLSHLRPKATGTVRFLPELGILETAPAGSDIQSSYGKTTEINREFHRGFMEFAIPPVDGQVLEATLFLGETGARIVEPRPPDLHELSYYPADLDVNIDDFDRPTTLLDTFETDANLDPAEFSFDVTRPVNDFRGRNLGFRIKLAADPDHDQDGWLGSEFGSLAAPTPRLEIKTKKNSFLRGDPAADGKEDLSDVIAILGYLFIGADRDKLQCEKSADVDDTGVLDVTDGVYLLLHLFLGGPAPGEPFRSCGVDPTEDDLGCASFPPCPL